ncbi:phiSA1p31-related protein [Streptomyces sp. NPDC046161]|uniref:phiSA1p31-related protein n=1 Tax=Streptomyces sp. NPDC046161 TaxID=3155132 RepID=UPI0033C133C4
MTLYLHDDVEFDLDCKFVDVTGVIWSWTGGWSPAGEPMLRSDASGPDLPLPDAYYYHGPLIPRRARITVKPSEAFAATVAAGYVETDSEFGVRIGGRP